MSRLVKTAVLLALTTGLLAPAQESTGTISGVVTDPTDASVPVASVTVTNRATGVRRRTVSDNGGLFVLTSLPVGDYKLLVECPGFKRYEGTSIRLDVNDRLAFPIHLEVGVISETVSVTENATQLQTESAELSDLIGSTQTQALPLNGRVFSQLVELVPGVVSQNGTIGNGVGLASDTAVSVNGNQSNSNLWLLDGQNNVDAGGNAQNVVTPPLDALEEFKVLRSNYSAEFGGATGGVVNVVTKQGTRDLHGSVYEYFRNDALDANDFFLNQQGQPRNELRFNNFGYTVGGPFFIPRLYNKDRTKDFFFLSYEGRREVRGNAVQDNVPTPAERNGDLSSLGEGMVPASEIDPNARAILARYPQPNATGAFNFVASLPKNTVDNVQLYRWDHNFSDKAMLMARVMTERQDLSNINNQLWADDNFPSVASDWKFSALNTVVKLTNILTPRVVNDFQFGYTNNFINFKTSKSSDPVLASRAGFTYTELFPETSGSFPTVNGVDGFGTLSHQAPFTNREALLQWQDNLAWTVGGHSVKVGFAIGRGRKREPANGGYDDTAGQMSFNSFQDLLLGNLASYSEEETLNPVYDRWHDYAIFVQDTWKVARGLTLDLGLRWQYLGQAFSARDNIANFYPGLFKASSCSPDAFSNGLVDPTLCNTLNGIVAPKSSGIPNRALVHNYPNGWEPRAGIAWSPQWFDNRLVVRAGGGIFHGRDAISQTSALGLLPPNDRTATLTGVTIASLAPFDPTAPQPPTTLQTLDPNYHIPSSYQYSATVQYALDVKTVLDVGYAGSRQVHQGLNYDINQVPNAYLGAVYDYENSGGTVGVNPDTVRPYLGYSHIYVNQRDATSRYNSLQVAANRRLTQGLQFQLAYTWSRLISDTINADTEGHANPVQNIFDVPSEKALGNQDQPQAVSVNAVWEIPWFSKSANRFMKNSLGGWQLNGIFAARSGLPQTVCVDHDVVGLASGGSICERVNVVSNPNLSRGQRTVVNYFDTNAFELQAPGTFGNSARNNVRGPGLNNFDLSLFKNFGLEKARLQLRAEFFNAFNHTQFLGINTTFVAGASSPFGAVTGARDPRELQFALKLLF